MPVTVRGRFRRSVHLERDFYGAGADGGYVVTVRARETVARVAEALAAPVAQRAWSVTGPYGGGKSAFALFLAGLLRGDGAARGRLREADAPLADRLAAAAGGPFCPVLVVGSREPLVPALRRGLAAALDAFAARQRPDPFADALGRLAAGARAAEGETDLLDLYDAAARAVHEETGGGLVVVVDEMGKLLEHAALYPERGDLFALQRLAERASRAGSPVLLFTILHQAFERYAGRLGSTQRDEWRKVQGRFEDVAFVEPVGETLRLLAEAVEATPDAVPATAEAEAGAVLAQTRLPAHQDRDETLRHLVAAAPVHPAVALLVGPLFRRLAQGERSLFAFLASGERHGLLDVVGGDGGQGGLFPEPAPFYRLDALYDYLVAGLGATLFSERMERLWAETEAALRGLSEDSPLRVQLVKHAALLGFAGPLAGLDPTAATLAATTGRPEAEAVAALDALREARVLAYRPFGETYHVWQGSGFDLDAALREARAHVPAGAPLAALLAQTAPPAPLVARRHSYRTGTTRAFEAVYVSDADWRTAAAEPHRRADGRVLYVLPETESAESTVGALRAGLDDPMTLAAVPDGVGALRESVRALACLDWVRQHSEALRGDPAARRETDEQRATLAAEVERRLDALLRADADGRTPCTWVRAGEAFRVDGERALQETLSAVCDNVYTQAPEVWNELLNRRKPSSAAVRGLKLLLAAAVEHGDRERLGIAGTPAEFGMYASVLRATGIHRPAEEAEGDGAAAPASWRFARPDEERHPGCAAVWDRIAETLRAGAGQPVPVHAVYEALAAAPYGVREGLIPVFLFAFAQSRADEVAFYESGTFVREMTLETIERLLKSEEKGTHTFAVQWVEVDAARAEVLAEVGPLVGLPASVRKPLPVALQVLRRVHALPPYVRRTGRLSEAALAVRGALERAMDPTRLVFETLPEACGAGSFLTDAAASGARLGAYRDGLGQALRELGGAYDALILEIQDQVAAAFRLRAAAADGRRRELANRARAVLPAADLRLKAFLVRASDEMADARAWTESLAALLAKSPPAQWGDEDARRFSAAVRETARAFDTVEPLALDLASGAPAEAASGSGAARRVRVLVKALGEREHDGVVHVHPEDDATVDALADRVGAALAESGVHADVQIAALGRLAARLLDGRARPAVPDDLPDHA